MGEKVPTPQRITALGMVDEQLYAVTNSQLHQLNSGMLHPVDGAPGSVHRIWDTNNQLWLSNNEGLHLLSDQGWKKLTDKVVKDLTLHLGLVHIATHDTIYRYESGQLVDIKPESGYLSSDSTVIMADGSQVLSNPVRIAPINGIASHNETLYILGHNRLALLDGPVFFPNPIDWGAFNSDTLRDIHSHGSRLCITTTKGLAEIRGMALTTLDHEDGLPYDDTTCVTTGFNGDLWIGTTTGAIRQTGEEFHYFGRDLWLPGDHVHDIAVYEQSVYIATDGGLAIIHYKPWTLRKKADYFEKRMEQWGHIRMGFAHKIYWGGEENGWLREVSDNDGGNTAHYLGAMAFKYAVTKDPKDRAKAVDAFEAMVWLDEITPKDGFIARSIWSVDGDIGKLATQGSGGLPAKWYESDDGKWIWKGDTSSDEVNAHYYAVSLFHDLVANKKEKDRAAKHLANIATHIMDNGWVLRDMDGEPTRWGRWDPEYLLQPYGHEAAGLNGMEAQTYVITAHSLSGEDKFQDGLQQLMDWGYHTYTVRQKLTFPPQNVVPWDDELAFRCYIPLLRYTEDPYLRSIYLRSLDRHWEVMRMQKVPFYNFSYGALTGNDCETDIAVQHLREWPLDTKNYSYRNMHRGDLAPEPGYPPYSKGTRAMSPRETTAMCGSRSAINYNGGNGGRTVTAPVGWLEDYWMGVYFGFIELPDTRDKALLEVPRDLKLKEFAKPYSGSPRPPITY